MQKLLVTGASGFLGWHLCQTAQSSWQVLGTYCHHSAQIPGAALYPVDLTRPEAVIRLLDQLQPDAIIHTAAQSKPNACETDPLAYAINVEATKTLARWCAARQVPFGFTSTEQVFDGTAAPYTEADSPCPINRYGQQKAEAEAAVSQIHPGASICRLPLLYGAATPYADSFVQGFWRQLQRGHLSLFVDEYRTPALVDDVAAGLLLALDHPGILHLGSPQRISRYDFGLLMAELLQLPAERIQAVKQADVPMAAKRPADVSSDSRKAYALGYAPRPPRAGLLAIAWQLGQRTLEQP